MKFRSEHPPWAGVILTALILIGSALPDLAHAQDEPVLIVRLIGGESAVYPLMAIEQIRFEEDAVMVISEYGEDTYLAETIARIDFNFDFSGITNPENAAVIIKAIRLFQNRPNPFSPDTQISFELPQPGEVQLRIVSPDGRLVRTLVNGRRPAGLQTVPWDGLDDAGRVAPGGVYFYSLRAPGIEECRRMILLP